MTVGQNNVLRLVLLLLLRPSLSLLHSEIFITGGSSEL
jgi:hypothetical protein